MPGEVGTSDLEAAFEDEQDQWQRQPYREVIERIQELEDPSVTRSEGPFQYR